MLQPGDMPAPFALNDQHNNLVDWNSLRGKRVVVFFYPKASTPGCTKEAEAFSAQRSQFEALGVTIIGASADSVTRQARFDEKFNLGLPLLSDPDRKILEPWGVWGEKKNYGKVYQGIKRSTFLFDENGTVVHTWFNVRVKGHVEAVLAEATKRFGTH